MKNKLTGWKGDMDGLTLGEDYKWVGGLFKDEEGCLRPVELGEWEEVPTEEHTGGSSSYYDLKVGPTTIKCLDIIEGLGMSYNEGNILKAVWRIAAAKQGKTKKGNNTHYDSEKIVFFGERLLEEHKEDV